MSNFDLQRQRVDTQFISGRDTNVTQHIHSQVERRPLTLAKLAAAEQRLAKLPVKTLPAAAEFLPPAWRMLRPRSPLFVGRESELRTVQRSSRSARPSF